MTSGDRESLVRDEFTRQVAGFRASTELSSTEPLERIAALVDVKPSETVLDVACGTGIVAEPLARSAASVVGIDLTEAMLAEARDRCERAGLTNVRFDTGNAEALPYEDDSFDVVITRLSFHHFPDPASVLDEMIRVTKPGGRLAVIDVISAEARDDSELHNAIEILRDPSHVRMLPKSELVDLFDSHGLRVAGEAEWVRQRRFDEWAELTGSPERGGPLRTIVSALARNGVSAGIGLRLDGDEPCFDHRWLGLLAHVADEHVS